MKLKSHIGSAASASLLTISLIVGVTISVTSANAQTSYYWGNTQLDDAVSVNLNVLETLGEAPNLPGLLSPRAISAPKPMAMPSSILNNQAPRLNAPASTALFPSSGLTSTAAASGMPSSGLVSSMPKATVSTPAPATSPAPAPAPAVMKAPEKKQNVKKQEAKIVTPAPAPQPTPAPRAAEVKKEAPKVVKAPEPVAKPTETAEPTAAIPESKLVKDTTKKVETKVAKTEPTTVPTPAAIPVAPKAEKKAKALVSVTPKPVPEAAPALASKKPEVAKKKTDSQVASVPKIADPKIVKTEGDVIRILFNETATDVPGGAKPALDDLVKMMQENESMGLQLEGYANIPNASPNQSRRMSLFRAISVRNYLVKHEIQSRRIEVRALGNKSDEASADRVDVFIKN